MQVMTIREAIEKIDDAVEQSIYVYRDGKPIFYVGRSDQPFERLRQHLGEGEYSSDVTALGALFSSAAHLH